MHVLLYASGMLTVVIEFHDLVKSYGGHTVLGPVGGRIERGVTCAPSELAGQQRQQTEQEGHRQDEGVPVGAREPVREERGAAVVPGGEDRSGQRLLPGE